VIRDAADQARSLETVLLSVQPHADAQLPIPRPHARYSVTTACGRSATLDVRHEHVTRADWLVHEVHYLPWHVAERYLQGKGYTIRRLL
jgi:hypothetical protein